tara:strand:+ start:1444 stop:1794 length:351 start_codon:yes stop_codon:yes gene_type:complete
MLINTNFNAAQVAYDRIADTELHFRRHGASLCVLLDVFGESAGGDAFCELYGFLSSQQPDPNKIHAALQQIKIALSNQSAKAADMASRERGFDADAALRWHGARISELLERFNNAV